MKQARDTTTPIPPLQNGDRLTRPEFERRCEAMPEDVKAELIDGIVYMITSVRFESHGAPHGLMVGWLAVYAAATPGVEIAVDTTIRLDLDNEVRPDVLLRIETECGGASRLTEDDYLSGPPELVIEIAASSAAYDMHKKKEMCRRHGVQEYLVWQIFENRPDWFVLEDGAYLRLDPDAEGLLRSRVFPGLHLAAEALLEGNLSAVLEAARQGTESEEHAAFTKHLRQARSED